MKEFKVGQRWRTRNGNIATIRYTEFSNHYPIMAVIGNTKFSFSKNGTYWKTKNEEGIDLIELIEEEQEQNDARGESPNKHVHADLIHAWADGAEIEYFDEGKWFGVKVPAWNVGDQYRIKPEVKYPETKLTNDELSQIFDDTGRHYLDDFANIIIKRFCESGQAKEWVENGTK